MRTNAHEGVRILIIDDMPPIHADFRKILNNGANHELEEAAEALFGGSAAANRPMKVQLDSAYQGSEGLTLVESAAAEGRPYAIAFVDVRMPPGWDGLETSTRLWQVDPDLQIVICTAYSDYSWEELTGRLGQTDSLLILKKPFDNIEVLQLTHALAKKSTLTREAKHRMADLDAQVNQRTNELRAANEKLVLENAERGRAAMRIAAFANLGLRLSAAKTSREAALSVVEVADKLLGWDSCMCGLYSPETGLLSLVLEVDVVEGKRTEFSSKRTNLPPSPAMRRVIKEGGQLFSDAQPRESSPFSHEARLWISRISVPILNGQDVIGILSIQSYAAGVYNQSSLETLQALAEHCGGALDRIEAEAALREAQDQLRQSQKLEAIGQLAGGVAHDFNNILAAMMLQLGLMRLGMTLDPETREGLAELEVGAKRAATLTRQLLMFGRRSMLEIKNLDTNGVVENVLKMLRRLLGENINLSFQPAAGLPAVEADTGMLEQVLVNLSVNARDAMPKGGQLTISTEAVEVPNHRERPHPAARPGRFVCLTVADTGCGMDEPTLKRIFEPFFTTKQVGKGTGLGLATVHGIVAQHEGWVEAESQLEQGSTFRVYLPAVAHPLEAAGGKTATGLDTWQDLRGEETILLVEDEAGVRRQVGQILRTLGYRVLEASNGPEALAQWEVEVGRIALLFTDMVMPAGLSGMDLLERFRAQTPALKVIISSGYHADIPSHSRPLMAGVVYLPKPYEARALGRAVRSCLDGR